MFVVVMTLFITGFASSTSNAQNGSAAVTHLEQVNTPFVQMKTEIWQYLKAITSGKSARKVEKKRKKLIQELGAAKKEIKLIKPFEGDATFKNAALEYVDISTTVLNEDFSKIVDMEEIAEQSYDKMEAYLMAREAANDRLDEASAKFQASYRTFAASNNINIVDSEEDEISKKIRNASEALEYYNDIYLIFFKSYKQEMYVLDAQGRNDVSGFQQNVNSLSSFSAEGLAKLDTMSGFKGSKAIIAAAKNMLKFYQSEAEKDFPKVIDFYLEKDKMDKLSEEIQGMRDAQRTKEVVDKYNKSSEEFNADVQTSNADNNRLNQKRADSLNRWNASVSTFFANYSE